MRGRVPAGGGTVLLVGLCVLSLGACSDSGLSVQEVRERGFLRAGYTDEPPYAFRDSTGRVTGESPQALHLAAEALGIEDIRWVRLDFRELIPGLRQGRIDVIAAGMFSTPERAERVRFTRPTACSGPAAVVKAGRRTDSAIVAVDASTRLAVVEGSVEQATLERLGVPPERLLVTPDPRTALAAVSKSRVDAFAITEPTARWLLRQEGAGRLGVTTYEAPAAVADLLRGCSALAFRHADAGLASAFDSALASVIEAPERRARLEALGFSAAPAPPAKRRPKRVRGGP